MLFFFILCSFIVIVFLFYPSFIFNGCCYFSFLSFIHFQQQLLLFFSTLCSFTYDVPLLCPLFIISSSYSSFISFIHSHKLLLVFFFYVHCSFSIAIVVLLFSPLFILTNSCCYSSSISFFQIHQQFTPFPFFLVHL